MGRSRRPPKDPLNAMLSFAYSLLTKDWTVTLHTVGFDPRIERTVSAGETLYIYADTCGSPGQYSVRQIFAELPVAGTCDAPFDVAALATPSPSGLVVASQTTGFDTSLGECCNEANSCGWDNDGFCDCGGTCGWDAVDCGGGTVGVEAAKLCKPDPDVPLTCTDGACVGPGVDGESCYRDGLLLGCHDGFFCDPLDDTWNEVARRIADRLGIGPPRSVPLTEATVAITVIVGADLAPAA